jgi:hypothetical protein
LKNIEMTDTLKGYSRIGGSLFKSKGILIMCRQVAPAFPGERMSERGMQGLEAARGCAVFHLVVIAYIIVNAL